MTKALHGSEILIVEDEALIAFDIAEAFARAGAIVLNARSIAEAEQLVEHENLAAVILDFGLADGDASTLCRRLTERSIPFVLHSGYNEYGTACGGGIVVPKPAHPDQLIAAVATLLN